MTPELVRQKVADIEACSDDDEGAHGMEDDLWLGVLTAIAHGLCADPAAVAREAIRTRGIKFARWCA